jgi:hypothetical protein
VPCSRAFSRRGAVPSSKLFLLPSSMMADTLFSACLKKTAVSCRTCLASSSSRALDLMLSQLSRSCLSLSSFCFSRGSSSSTSSGPGLWLRMYWVSSNGRTCVVESMQSQEVVMQHRRGMATGRTGNPASTISP